MSFLQWTFLFGALAVVGPMVAHLLSKPRFRRVPFTMLRFLRSGQRESQSQRRLRDLLVLLLRCAIIALIAVLFAQPILERRTPAQKHKSLFYLGLDNSASMAYREGNKTLLSQMTAAARDYVKQAPADARFCIHALASNHAAEGLTKQQAVAEIRRLAVTPRPARIADFVSTVRQADRTAPPASRISAVVFSDFAPNTLRQLEQVFHPASVHEWSHQTIRPAGPINNAALVTARAVDVAGRALTLDVTVANYGDTQQPRILTAALPDVPPVTVDVDLAPRQQRVVRLQIDLGLTLVGPDRPSLPIELSLSPSDNVVEDDTYRLAVSCPSQSAMRVVVVGLTPENGAEVPDETFLFETALEALARRSDMTELEVKTVTESHLSSSALRWADVVVFSSLPAELLCRPAELANVIERGGRVIFFTTAAGNSKLIERLWRQELLPVLPERWIEETVYLQAQPCTRTCPGFDERAARSLSNYRPDRIAVKGYWQCRIPHETVCLWRLANGQGFLYSRSLGPGWSILVNTSMDDSLGLLAKSGAWVAFCRYLLGESRQMQQFCFSADEKPVVNLPDRTWTPSASVVSVENCDGTESRARVESRRLFLPAPTGLGWIKTLDAQPWSVGINLPAGETDLGDSTPEAVAAAVSNAFTTETIEGGAPVHAGTEIERIPVWKALAWIILVLVLCESALTSRLKR